MPTFTTRVELHKATNDDYEELHAAMERRGFSRFITGNGSTYHLPTAEYNYSGDETKREVLALAKAAATETQKKFAVLVTESNGRTWIGLEEKS